MASIAEPGFDVKRTAVCLKRARIRRVRVMMTRIGPHAADAHKSE
jgi:hypothetical protein